jgi:hypothetical protein
MTVEPPLPDAHGTVVHHSIELQCIPSGQVLPNPQSTRQREPMQYGVAVPAPGRSGHSPVAWAHGGSQPRFGSHVEPGVGQSLGFSQGPYGLSLSPPPPSPPFPEALVPAAPAAAPPVPDPPASFSPPLAAPAAPPAPPLEPPVPPSPARGAAPLTPPEPAPPLPPRPAPAAPARAAEPAKPPCPLPPEPPAPVPVPAPPPTLRFSWSPEQAPWASGRNTVKRTAGRIAFRLSLHLTREPDRSRRPDPPRLRGQSRRARGRR